MKKLLVCGVLFVACLALSSFAMAAQTKKNEGFGGVIAKKYEDSKEWWAPQIRPPEGAPNVIIFGSSPD